MAKIYMYRHQHAGIVTSHVFATPPTDAQMAPLRAECERLHGRAGWDLIHEAEFMQKESDIPSFPERAPPSDGANAAAISTPMVEASGTVTNRE